jgi:ADP-ribose pyrophosphatase YjhB (NUDIX family)
MMSPYIRGLRGKIGTDFLLLPSVTVLVFNEQGEVMLVRHADKNLWVAPGGMIEPGERPEEAAVREMKEETGCEVTIMRLLGVYGGPEFNMAYQNGDKVGYVMSVYEGRIEKGEIMADGVEILEVKFFSREEIKNLSCGKWMPVVMEDLLRNKDHQSSFHLNLRS